MSDEKRSTNLFDRRAKVAFVLVCVTMIAAAAGFRSAVRSFNVYLQKEPVELQHHFDVISGTLGRWEKLGDVRKMSDEMVEELGTDLYMERAYAWDGDADNPTMLVHLAYYTGMIDAVPHVPDRCLVAGGFNIQSPPTNVSLDVSRDDWRPDPFSEFQVVSFRDPIIGDVVTVRMPEGDFGLRVTEFSHPEQPQMRMYGGYFFIANNRIAVSPEQVKRLAFVKTERYAYYCKVQFMMSGDRTLTREAFLEHSSNLLDELLPQLMHCLPDWAEVQSRTETTESTEHPETERSL